MILNELSIQQYPEYLIFPDEFHSSLDRRALTKYLFSLSSTLDEHYQLISLKKLSELYAYSKSDSAFYYADQAFDRIEKQRLSAADGVLRADIFSRHATFYSMVGGWRASIQGDYESAFQMFEASKSRALLDQLAEKNAPELELSPEDQILLQQHQKKIDQLFRQKENTRSPEELETFKS